MTDRTCSLDGCDRPHVARGWCGLHWRRWKKEGDPGEPYTRRIVGQKFCGLDSCDSPYVANGLCGKHLARLTLTGTTDNARDKSEEQKFWERVSEDHPLGCWVWTGAVWKGGSNRYGRFGNLRAHRWSYEHHVGPIPEGLVIDHLCRNTLCVNPEHLEAVTDKVNILRGISPPALNALRDECKRGHPLSGDNLVATKSGNRQCRKCAYAAASRWRARRDGRTDLEVFQGRP